MSKVIIQACTSVELMAKLSGLDVRVPQRSEGRRKNQTELYSIVHLLNALPPYQFSFPMTLTHSDKPDFLLAMGGHTIGIEQTEAVPENVARAQVLREMGLGPDVYFTPHVKPGEPRQTANELRRRIEADEPGDGWCGDFPQIEWAAAILHCVKRKIPKATNKGFVRYFRNWLVIYDNWPLPAVDYVKAITYLEPKLARIRAFSTFDTIFVHDDSRLCMLLNASDFQVLNCNRIGDDHFRLETGLRFTTRP